MEILGIDVGGSGAKGAIVDTATGRLITDRYKIRTPGSPPPHEMGEILADIADHHDWEGAVGCALPSVVRNGVVRSAANVHPDWIGVDARPYLEGYVKGPVHVLNDADAAGLAEVRLGAGRGHDGVVLLLTFGTGIGSALFSGGRLLPNTELGHLELRGGPAEHWAAARLRKKLDLTWGQWIERVNEYLEHVEYLLAPDLIIFGGGVSKNADEYLHLVRSEATVVPARFRNLAGIVGAAIAAAEAFAQSSSA